MANLPIIDATIYSKHLHFFFEIILVMIFECSKKHLRMFRGVHSIPQ